MPTTKPGSDNEFPKLLLVEGAAPAAPSAGRIKLYAKSDGLLYWKDDAGVEHGAGSGAVAAEDVSIADAGALYTGTDVEAALAEIGAHPGDTSAAHAASAVSIADAGAYFTGTDVEAALQELGAGGGGGGAEDVIADLFGAPATAYEFDSTSLTGLTAMGTPDAEDADTTIAGHYYVKDNASGVARCGRYAAVPSTPYTVITKITDASVRFDYNQVGLFIGEGTPGAMRTIQWSSAIRRVETESQTPTTFVASIGSASGSIEVPLYLAIVVHSGTDVDFLYSYGGRLWMMHTEALNPGFTIGSAGIVITANNSNGVAAAFDFLRIWTSALTFPGTY